MEQSSENIRLDAQTLEFILRREREHALELDIVRRQLAELALKNEDLQQQLYIDAKTGIQSYTYFREQIIPEIEAQINSYNNDKRKSNRRLVLVFADINGMNRINSELNHAQGDNIICSVAKKLKSNIRSDDSLCRFGEAADEFCVLLRFYGNEDTTELTKQLINRCKLSVRNITDDGICSVSMGFVPVESYNSAYEVIDAASKAMYADKAAHYEQEYGVDYAHTKQLPRVDKN